MNAPTDRQLVEDSCAASAAELSNLMPELMNLPAPERYARLLLYLATTVAAVYDRLRNWYVPPEPSPN